MTLTTEQQEKLTALKNAMDGYFVNESDLELNSVRLNNLLDDIINYGTYNDIEW